MDPVARSQTQHTSPTAHRVAARRVITLGGDAGLDDGGGPQRALGPNNDAPRRVPDYSRHGELPSHRRRGERLS